MAIRKHIANRDTMSEREMSEYTGDDAKQFFLRQAVDHANLLIEAGGSYYGAEILPYVRACERIVARPESFEEWEVSYANQILRIHAMVKEAIQNNDADRAAKYAYHFGTSITEAGMKLTWEKLAMTGKQVTDGGENRGRPKKTDRNNAMAQKYSELRKTSPMGDTDLKESIGEEYGLKRSQAVEAINSGLNYLSDKTVFPDE